ncbi:hypothetical protein [Chryseobacterium lathyri]|uniref:Uncharacterized protein n=1 Tax=Chryseobacterium lathyri TaxID=395933 RepID=A0ABT9SMC9_9FLAO|nr:hypothetical protein [Chryseobacterium lathyri]MDP9960599.1 hypothetical protein [Chryseobacterium lathyri]MDQ0065902.1 hypothetical protein [Chryseobacterium lathyri]
MKENFGEKHKLPLSFKQMEYFEHKSTKKIDSNTLCILKSEKYQSDFYVREKPVKPLIRLL